MAKVDISKYLKLNQSTKMGISLKAVLATINGMDMGFTFTQMGPNLKENFEMTVNSKEPSITSMVISMLANSIERRKLDRASTIMLQVTSMMVNGLED